jgi:hypothetical protein
MAILTSGPDPWGCCFETAELRLSRDSFERPQISIAEQKTCSKNMPASFFWRFSTLKAHLEEKWAQWLQPF